MRKKRILSEILYNIKEIILRTQIIGKLLFRLFHRKPLRTTAHSNHEYETFWDDFWEKREYLKTTYPMLKNGVLLSPSICPLAFKELVIVEIIAEKIKKFNCSTVLEIGSGAGLNLLLLAPRFPNVQFHGIEPTASGIRVTDRFLKNPPKEFELASKASSIDNVTVVQGNILQERDLGKLQGQRFDLVFTSAVLEQLNNYIDIAFTNIFNIDSSYFLFYEEWLDANSSVSAYKTLVDSDYFRIPVKELSKYPVDNITFEIPSLQPSWLSYGVVTCEKNISICFN